MRIEQKFIDAYFIIEMLDNTGIVKTGAKFVWKTHIGLLPDAFECASQALKNEEKIMALLNILQYPDERLHTVAKPVEQVDERIQKLVADMFETMYEARGYHWRRRRSMCTNASL